LPQELLETAEFSHKLEEILASLPKIYQITVVLHLQHDLTFQEIADLLGESINTIKSRYRSGLLMIRENFIRK
jgi:RNA polymerase sigma-70 factor (ECF subfamily)